MDRLKTDLLPPERLDNFDFQFKPHTQVIHTIVYTFE